MGGLLSDIDNFLVLVIPFALGALPTREFRPVDWDRDRSVGLFRKPPSFWVGTEVEKLP
jgi:hypothetical protein